MKKLHFIRYALFVIAFMVTTVSCDENYLEKKPLDQLSDADMWNDPALAETFINNIYRSLTPADGAYETEVVTNNGVQGILWSNVYVINKSGWNPSFTNNDRNWFPETCNRGCPWDAATATEWKLLYREIRATNVAITNLIKEGNTDTRTLQLIAEAKILRAFKYHELIRKYGGAVILDKPLGLTDDAGLPRNTYKECVDFIVKDLNEAADVLPDKWTGGYLGRASKGTALALKGRVQLSAGRWAEAAATYKSVIDNKAAFGFGLFPDFKGLFLEENENNSEAIFSVQFSYPQNTWSATSSSLPGSALGWGAGNPTQNLVDQFELKDGKAWNDPTSIYYDPNDPYAGRDPRFYATVMYDQGVYFGKRLETGSGMDGNGNLVKGIDIEKTNDVSQTNYYLCKMVDTSPEQAGTYAPSNSPHNGTNLILMRYAEVLLGYAEAQNEAAGPDASVYDAVNQVRSRVNIPNIPVGSKEQVRQLIRKERRVELAFEYQYFWDLLRWHAKDQFTEAPQKVVINYTYDLNPDGTVKTDETGRKIVLSRTFSYAKYEDRNAFNLDQYNWFIPLPQEEIDKNPNLIQNGIFADLVE